MSAPRDFSASWPPAPSANALRYNSSRLFALRVKLNQKLRQLAQYPTYCADYAKSRSFEVDVDRIATVCLLLGPDRNLTGLISGLLFLHPSCQVLNNAGVRILPLPPVNFLKNGSDRKLEAFLKYAIYISRGGDWGFYGGTILRSHTFKSSVFKDRYEARFGGATLKQDIRCFLWKDAMRATSYLRERRVDVGALLDRQPKLRFLLPIRNPLDCAVSNYRTGHANRFSGLADYAPEPILDAVLEHIAWFLDLEKEHPGRLLHFYEDGLDEDWFRSLADFLGLEPHREWLDDALACSRLNPSYDHPREFMEHYSESLRRILGRHPEAVARLERLAASAPPVTGGEAV